MGVRGCCLQAVEVREIVKLAAIKGVQAVWNYSIKDLPDAPGLDPGTAKLPSSPIEAIFTYKHEACGGSQ
jgi:hypothetical protein